MNDFMLVVIEIQDEGKNKYGWDEEKDEVDLEGELVSHLEKINRFRKKKEEAKRVVD